MPPQRHKHKLSRKELKQDGFVDWTGRAVEYVQANYLRLAIGVLALVVVILAAAFVVQGRERARERASELLFQGQTLLAGGNYTGAAERLQEAVDRYGGTSFGLQARVELAHALLAAGQPEQALETAHEGLEKIGNKDPELRHSMLMVEGAILVSLKRWDDAAVVYRGLLAQELPTPLRVEASFQLADVLRQQGDLEAAVKVLEDLQQAVDKGEIPGPVRDLAQRLSLYRALASR